MNSLVTGAAGFLGRRLVARLVAEGETVIAVSRSAVPDAFAGNANIRWIERDILREGLRADEVRDVETVFHLAGGSGGKRLQTGEDERVFVEANEVLAIQVGEDNLAVKRLGTGVSPMHWDEVVGRPAKRDFEPDELIEL